MGAGGKRIEGARESENRGPWDLDRNTRPLDIISSWKVLQKPPENKHIIADQHSTLVGEASIATHHGGCTGDADRRALGMQSIASHRC